MKIRSPGLRMYALWPAKIWLPPPPWGGAFMDHVGIGIGRTAQLITAKIREFRLNSRLHPYGLLSNSNSHFERKPVRVGSHAKITTLAYCGLKMTRCEAVRGEF